MKAQKRHMLRAVILLCICSVSNGWLTLGHATSVSADHIATLSSEVDKVQNWSANTAIQILAPDGKRRIREGKIKNMLGDSMADAKRFYRFERPRDIEGTSLLIHENHLGDDDIWIYLPSLGKSRRIVSGNKNNSFVGTEFSYIDMMTLQVSDYNHVLFGKESIENVECHVLESSPKSSEVALDTGYSKMRTWIRSDNFVSIKIDYFDLKGQLLKTQYVSGLRHAPDNNARWIAARRHMVNHQSGRETVIQFEKILINGSMSKRDFAPSQLSRQ